MKKDKKINDNAEHVKKKHKIHVFDVVIVILLVAILVGVYFRYNVFDMFGNMQNQHQAEVTFSVKNIQDSTKHYISIDEAVYFKSDGKQFGTIMQSSENSNIALIITPASETFIDSNTHNVITAQYPADTRIDATGKIKCTGVFSDDGTFLLNGSTYICSGQTMTVCTERVTLEITIADIKQVG